MSFVTFFWTHVFFFWTLKIDILIHCFVFYFFFIFFLFRFHFFRLFRFSFFSINSIKSNFAFYAIIEHFVIVIIIIRNWAKIVTNILNFWLKSDKWYWISSFVVNQFVNFKKHKIKRRHVDFDEMHFTQTKNKRTNEICIILKNDKIFKKLRKLRSKIMIRCLNFEKNLSKYICKQCFTRE